MAQALVALMVSPALVASLGLLDNQDHQVTLDSPARRDPLAAQDLKVSRVPTAKLELQDLLERLERSDNPDPQDRLENLVTGDK